MKKLLLSYLLLMGLGAGTISHAAPATKDDIKQLVHYMDKRFEDMQKGMDKRFDDMNRRFDMLMWFIGILTVLSTATIGYIVNRLGKHEERFSDVDARLKHVDLSAFLKDLRSADPAIKKGLKEILK